MDNELAELTAEGLTEEEIESVKNGDIKEPVFPIMIFTAALTKDILDIIEALGVFTFGIIGIITNTFMVPLIYAYVNTNLSLSQKYIYKRLIGKAVVEFVPWLSAVSFWSLFVWRAHNREKKKMEKVLNIMNKTS
ncbi:MAG: hypothetical protein Q8Q90_02135 [bacterium]|nr:hypothetical protein [bacterium]